MKDKKKHLYTQAHPLMCGTQNMATAAYMLALEMRPEHITETHTSTAMAVATKRHKCGGPRISTGLCDALLRKIDAVFSSRWGMVDLLKFSLIWNATLIHMH